MLTSNAKSIFSDNVTCFARSKHVSQIRDICKSASIAPHFLLARLQRNRFQLVIHLVFLDPSRIHLAASPLSVSCRLLSRHSVPTSWDFSLAQVEIDSNSLDVYTTKHVRSSRKVQEYTVVVTPYSFSLSASCRLLSRKSVRVSEDYSPEQVGIDISVPCTHEMSLRPNM